VAWVVGTLAGLGLPDRVLFEAASCAGRSEDLPDREGQLHGAYVVGIVAVHGVLFQAAPLLAGVVEAPLVELSRWFVVGAALQALSAYPFCARRGLGRPEIEAVTLLVAGGVLVLGMEWTDLNALGLCWVVSCGVQAAMAVWVSWTTAGLRPRWPAQWTDMVGTGLPWLGFGVGAWLIGNMDVLTARWIASADAVGQLQVGTMVVRAGGVLPWIVVTLSLHRLEASWRRGESVGKAKWMGWAAGLTVVIAGSAYGLMPFLARAHGLPLASIVVPTWTAVACTPFMVAALMLLPVAAARDRNGTLRSIGWAVIVGALMLLFRPLGLGVSDTIVAAASAQLVVAVSLALRLNRR